MVIVVVVVDVSAVFVISCIKRKKDVEFLLALFLSYSISFYFTVTTYKPLGALLLYSGEFIGWTHDFRKVGTCRVNSCQL